VASHKKITFKLASGLSETRQFPPILLPDQWNVAEVEQLFDLEK
jgi:hypothetical protein